MTGVGEAVTSVAPSPFDRLRARNLLALFLLAMLVASVAVAVVTPGQLRRMDERALGIVMMLAVAFVLLVSARRAGLDWRRVFGRFPERDSLPLLAVVAPIILLTFAAVYAVFVPLSYAWPGVVERHLLAPKAFFEVTTVPQWLGLVVAGCVMAPLIEETIFRGILMQRWARRWGTLTGVLASSAVFALLHQEWIGKILFGVAMCALYLRTRRLWMPIAAHAINNAVFIMPTLSDVLAHRHEQPETLAEFRAHWWIGVLCLVGGLLLLWWYLRRYWPNGRLAAVLRGPVPYDAQQ